MIIADWFKLRNIEKLWSTGVFIESREFDFKHIHLQNCVKRFATRKLRINRSQIHTIADPFLFVHGGKLFMFVEIHRFFEKGYIDCWETSDLKKWEHKGTVLKRPFHISYPFIFKDVDGSIYMIPETAEAGEVSLWKFHRFPQELRKERTLLKGKWLDSNILLHDNVYYLITTNDLGELHLFFNDSLHGEWLSHCQNPITNDMRYSRNGGGLLKISEQLFRIGQDCSSEYGAKIVVRRVLRLSKDDYDEEPYIDDFRPSTNGNWYSVGRHHISVAEFSGKSVIAMDGKEHDLRANQIYFRATTLPQKLKKLFG